MLSQCIAALQLLVMAPDEVWPQSFLPAYPQCCQTFLQPQLCFWSDIASLRMDRA